MYIHKRRTTKRYSTAIVTTGRIRAVRNGFIWRRDADDTRRDIYDNDRITREQYLRLYNMSRDCIFDTRYMRTAKRLDRNQRKRYNAWHNALKRRGPHKPAR